MMVTTVQKLLPFQLTIEVLIKLLVGLEITVIK